MNKNLLLRIGIPIALLGGFALLAFLALYNPPKAERRPPSGAPKISVEVLAIASQDYQVMLQSYGTVRPRIESAMVSQVSGQVTWINPQFRDGGFFKASDVLLIIDPRDYEADVKIAEAVYRDAQRSLAEEEAESAHALSEWQLLGSSDGEPSDLVLRKPQLMSARAKVASTRASLSKAQLNLERTKITALFDGRMLKKNVDLGQVVSPNMQLAQVYATDNVEVRLPLKNNDLGLISLPESGGTDGPSPTKVVLQSRLGSKQSWNGFIVRTEGAIDDVARQLHVVAQVEDPFRVAAGSGVPLKICEYVTAEIFADPLQGVVVIPNRAIYQGSYVYVVEEGLLYRRDIEIRWQKEEEAIVSSGLRVGDRLVLTPLGQVTSGTPVKVIGAEPAEGPGEPASVGARPGGKKNRPKS
jgi:RND family efflux transporter MFP subunit